MNTATDFQSAISAYRRAGSARTRGASTTLLLTPALGAPPDTLLVGASLADATPWLWLRHERGLAANELVEQLARTLEEQPTLRRVLIAEYSSGGGSRGELLESCSRLADRLRGASPSVELVALYFDESEGDVYRWSAERKCFELQSDVDLMQLLCEAR